MPVEIIIVLSVAVFTAILLYMEYLRSKYVLSVKRSKVVIPTLPEDFDRTKIVLISDLHQMRFGQNNETLARKILLEEPEYILFAGDMGDARAVEVDAFYDLIEALGKEIPIIVVPGNHDLQLGGGKVHINFLREITSSGAVLLNGTSASLVKGDSKLHLFGYCQPLTTTGSGKLKRCVLDSINDDTLAQALGECPQDAPSLVLTHDPTYFSRFADWGAALVFAGHNHGGLVRLPLLGGLFGSNFSFKPKYTAGEYSINNSKMYVTAGLAGSAFPRFFNPPEISSITLLREPEVVEPKAKKQKTAAAPVFSFKKLIGDIRSWFANAISTVRSEWRSFADLIHERSNQISDFFAEMFGKEKSRFAKKADDRKKHNTYTTATYRRRNGHDTEKKRREQHERLFGKSTDDSDEE